MSLALSLGALEVFPSFELSPGRRGLTPGLRSAPALAECEGELLAAWAQEGGHSGVVAVRLDLHGAVFGSPVLLAPGLASAPAVACEGKAFVVAWASGQSVLARRVDLTGQPLGKGPTVVGQGALGAQTTVSLARANDELILAWPSTARGRHKPEPCLVRLTQALKTRTARFVALPADALRLEARGAHLMLLALDANRGLSAIALGGESPERRRVLERSAVQAFELSSDAKGFVAVWRVVRERAAGAALETKAARLTSEGHFAEGGPAMLHSSPQKGAGPALLALHGADAVWNEGGAIVLRAVTPTAITPPRTLISEASLEALASWSRANRLVLVGTTAREGETNAVEARAFDLSAQRPTSPPISISADLDLQHAPDVAFAGGRGLAVWVSELETKQIHGARFSSDGGMLDVGGFVIAKEASGAPSVAMSREGSLVVWPAGHGAKTRIEGAFVSEEGTVGPPLTLAEPGAAAEGVELCARGDAALVVWRQVDAAGRGRLGGAWVDETGATSQLALPASTEPFHPRCSWGPDGPVVSWVSASAVELVRLSGKGAALESRRFDTRGPVSASTSAATEEGVLLAWVERLTKERSRARFVWVDAPGQDSAIELTTPVLGLEAASSDAGALIVATTGEYNLQTFEARVLGPISRGCSFASGAKAAVSDGDGDGRHLVLFIEQTARGSRARAHFIRLAPTPDAAGSRMCRAARTAETTSRPAL